jgi:hypothetical protein
MKPDFLQIGFQKCGSTYMDENVYSSNPKVHCFQAAKYLQLERVLLNQLILQDGFEYNEDNFERDYQDACSELMRSGSVNGIMFECFTFLYERKFDRKNVIDRLKKVHPDAKIIMYIRNQETWLLSHYSQYLKSGGLLSLYDFIECQLTNKNLDLHYIDWFPLISYLYEVFGKENVHICLYEDLRSSPQETADRVFDFLCVPRSAVNPDKVNPSLSSFGMEVRRFLNHFVRFDCGASNYDFYRDLNHAKPSLPTRLFHRFRYSIFKPVSNELCSIVDRVFKLRGKMEICDLQIQKIRSRYAGNNAKLSQLLGVDLGAVGYPVACGTQGLDCRE